MDIGLILANSFTQVIFFLINVSVIPWACACVIDKWGKAHSKILNEIIAVPTSWTVNLICDGLAIPLLWLTFNHPHPEFEIEDKTLMIYTNCDAEKQRWYRPVQQIGKFIGRVIWIIVPMVMSVALIRLMLPETFASLAEGIGRWTALQSGTTNLDYFIEMGRAFVDIVWVRFFGNAIKENPLFLIIFIVLFIFIFSSRFDFYYDENGDKRLSLGHWPWTVAGFVIFNFVLAAANPAGYAAISTSINSFGMILALILVLAQVANIIEYCSEAIIALIREIRGTRAH